MDSDALKWLVENGLAAVPFVLIMWTRLEMVMRKIGKQDIRLTNVENEQKIQQSAMFHRTGQINKQ